MKSWFGLIGVVFYLSVATNLYTDLNALENLYVMFDMGIAAPRQTLWDLFWDVCSSGC